MVTLTPAQAHAMQITSHKYIIDPSDSKNECLICNAFVTDLLDVWQTELENIHWFAFHNNSAIMEDKN